MFRFKAKQEEEYVCKKFKQNSDNMNLLQKKKNRGRFTTVRLCITYIKQTQECAQVHWAKDNSEDEQSLLTQPWQVYSRRDNTLKQKKEDVNKL